MVAHHKHVLPLHGSPQTLALRPGVGNGVLLIVSGAVGEAVGVLGAVRRRIILTRTHIITELPVLLSNFF